MRLPDDVKARPGELSVVTRIIVQEDTVDGIRRFSDVWRRVLHVGGDYF